MGSYASAGLEEDVDRARTLEIGDRVRFHGETQARFKVRARGDRYIVLTMPFNCGRPWQGKSLYTVIDVELGVRGTDNFGGLGYESPEDIADAMRRFNEGDAEISRRNNVTLRIADVKAALLQKEKG